MLETQICTMLVAAINLQTCSSIRFFQSQVLGLIHSIIRQCATRTYLEVRNKGKEGNSDHNFRDCPWELQMNTLSRPVPYQFNILLKERFLSTWIYLNLREHWVYFSLYNKPTCANSWEGSLIWSFTSQMHLQSQRQIFHLCEQINACLNQ